MNRKKELKQLYKEIKIEAGIYKITNNVNGKILIDSTRNLKTLNGKKHQLITGTCTNKELQEDWNKYGESSFTFEIVEILQEKKDGYFNIDTELEKLKEKWLNSVMHLNKRSYN
ncbi:MAG: catalytic domain protein [Bacillales bacterium]|jgi:hypothetical protein|nr:catalytic domain protein [Bacillales bacterium]